MKHKKHLEKLNKQTLEKTDEYIFIGLMTEM